MSEKKIPYWALDKEEMFVFVDYEGYFSATDCINFEQDYCAYIRQDLSIPIAELEQLLEELKYDPYVYMHEECIKQLQALINKHKGETE